jgi:hypothetical protein
MSRCICHFTDPCPKTISGHGHLVPTSEDLGEPNELDECEHQESENGVCNDCGDEVGWINRKFSECDHD